MKRFALLLLCVCGLPCVAVAQSVTFDFKQGTPQTYTYTPEEVASMTRLLAEVNRQRAAGSRGAVAAWTLEDWQMFVIRNTLSSYMTEVKTYYAQDGCEAFEKNLDAETKADVLTHFGGRNPCAPPPSGR